MTRAERPDRESQRRAWRLLRVLAPHTVNGLRLIDVAKALGVSSPTALRDLDAAAEEGIAQRIPHMDNRWTLGPQVVQIAIAFQGDLQRTQDRIAEIEQRYTREPS